jgi:hypothetical protein
MLRLSAGCVAVALTLMGCREPLSDSECSRLLERYTELLVRSDREDVTAVELERLKAQALARARREPAFAECSSKVSRRAYECAMAAENVDRMEQCLL